jgi:hypothetical protein
LNPGCLHRAPKALTPLMIRWGADAGGDMLRRSALCVRCGRKGATLTLYNWMGLDTGLAPFPVERRSCLSLKFEFSLALRRAA